MAGHADLVLSGHEHNFEAFSRQDADGNLNPSRGLAEFVVGTGGKSQYPIGNVIKNSRIHRAQVFGFLSMRLRPTSYNWRFVNDDGKTLNRGAAQCR